MGGCVVSLLSILPFLDKASEFGTKKVVNLMTNYKNHLLIHTYNNAYTHSSAFSFDCDHR
jgi:hypothetical protein